MADERREAPLLCAEMTICFFIPSASRPLIAGPNMGAAISYVSSHESRKDGHFAPNMAVHPMVAVTPKQTFRRRDGHYAPRRAGGLVRRLSPLETLDRGSNRNVASGFSTR